MIIRGDLIMKFSFGTTLTPALGLPNDSFVIRLTSPAIFLIIYEMFSSDIEVLKWVRVRATCFYILPTLPAQHHSNTIITIIIIIIMIISIIIID